MAINVSQAFHRTSANPIDETLALTKAQMVATNDNLMPPKYLTVCQDDGYIYLYDKSNSADVQTGKFRKFEGGGGGGGGTAGSVYTGTLLATGWNSTTLQQTLTFTDYSADYHGVVGVPADATSAQLDEYRDCVIRTVSQSGATVTFECETIPTVNLPVEIYCGGGGSAEFPSGGTTGQALVKKSNADNDVEWGDVGQTIQVDTMPTASASLLGKIYQFVGTTAGAYTNGRFYECVSDGAGTPTYSWVEKVVSKSKSVKDNGTVVTDREVLNFTDFDITDDSTNEETDVKAHRLTASEMADIMSTLPGAPTQQHTYSTTEQVVGKWIDGTTDVYEKTIHRDSIAPSTGIIIDTSLNQTNVRVIWKSGTGFAQAGNNLVGIGDIWVASGDNFRPVLWQHQNGIAIATDQTLTDIYVIVRYIKLT